MTARAAKPSAKPPTKQLELSEFGEPKYKHEWLRLDKLEAHPWAQRFFSKAHADGFAADFDPDQFNELIVVEKDGKFFICDGQHRAAAALVVLGPDQQVPCKVYRDVSDQFIATLVLGLNNAKKWLPIDRYKLRVKSGEWQARAIHGVLHQLNLHVAANADDGSVSAVAACDWIVESFGLGVLERTLRNLHGAYGRDRDAYHNSLLRGMALVCSRYNGSMDDKTIRDVLAKASGPGKMQGRARDRAKMDKVAIAVAAAIELVIEYNKRRGSKRLPPFSA